MLLFSSGDQASGFTALHYHGECRSIDKSLGKRNSVAECASACENTNGCKFFVYGTGVKDGYCYWEKTKSADCPEGWEGDKYDFYSLRSKYHCTDL